MLKKNIIKLNIREMFQRNNEYIHSFIKVRQILNLIATKIMSNINA